MPSNEKTHAAAYIRVSTQEQKLHGYSLDAQRDRLQAYADSHGMTIVKWYADEGVSGRSPIVKRSALMNMGADAAAGIFNVILFIKLDRFFRSVREYYEFEKISNATPWIAIDEPIYDQTTATGKLNINLKLAIAQMESEQTSEREKMVIDYKIKQGLALAGAQSTPYGFTVKDKRVVHDPETEANVIRIIEHFERTQNITETTKWTNANVDSVSYHRIIRLLKSSLLYGEFHGNMNYTEPYMDKARWDRLQDMVRERSKIYVGKDKKDQTVYLFNGLLVCPLCGTKLTGTKHGKYNVYRCNKYIRGITCTYSATVFEGTMQKRLLVWLENNLCELSSPTVNSKALPSVQKRDRSQIQAEIDRLNYSWQKGRLTPRAYDEQYDDLMNELKDLDAEPAERPISLPDNWREVYDDLSPMGRRSFWRSFIKRIDYHKVPNGKRPTVVVDNVVVL